MFVSELKMKISFVVFVALLAATAHGDKATNDFLDKILNDARPVIERELDPIDLPVERATFSKKILFVTVHGEAKVYNGRIYGLKNIHRSGDADVKYDNNKLVISAHAGINNLRGTYSAHASFMNLGPTVTAHLGISSVSVRLGARQDIKPDAHPDLYDFKIEHISGISVKISGLGPLGWILGTLTGFIANILKNVIADAVNTPIKNVLRNEFAKVSLPLS